MFTQGKSYTLYGNGGYDLPLKADIETCLNKASDLVAVIKKRVENDYC